MGELQVIPVLDSTDIRSYSQALFDDVAALEQLIEQGMIEQGVYRMGAEQELCLVDHHYRPAPYSDEILAKIDDPHFTTELAKFNLEINLDPLSFKDDCFALLAQQINTRLDQCKKVTATFDCQPLLTGILPTIRSTELSLDFMTTRQRYYALNAAIQHTRNKPQEFYIQGTDELVTNDKSVMFESCNTSFQIHYQLGAEHFVPLYNWAQAISAPVLAACTNSPMFMGRRLWRETRIALFQQATDTRGYQDELRVTKPRVMFGDSWLEKGLPNMIKEDISTFRPLVIREGLAASLKELEQGKIPSLKAYSLFNGTIYRWNRPCYGITKGKPHLRIENRYIPAGPTVEDQVANAAFWLGLMHFALDNPLEVERRMEFHQAKTNFLRAARHGLNTTFDWLDGKTQVASKLILKKLLPASGKGLHSAGIADSDIDHYLGIIQKRVHKGKTGCSWILNAFNSLSKQYSQDTALTGLTEGMIHRLAEGHPVHKWKPIQADEISDGEFRFQRIDQIMSKKLYTVSQDDIIDLVPNIMKWNQIRHMLVEDRFGHLVGLVTIGRLGQYYAEQQQQQPAVKVKDVMISKVITVRPDTPTLEALKLMKSKQIGCLPVLNEQNRLVGIVTEKDFLPIVESYLSRPKS